MVMYVLGSEFDFVSFGQSIDGRFWMILDLPDFKLTCNDVANWYRKLLLLHWAQNFNQIVLNQDSGNSENSGKNGNLVFQSMRRRKSRHSVFSCNPKDSQGEGAYKGYKCAHTAQASV